MSSDMSERRGLHVPYLAQTLPDGWSWSRLDDVCLGVIDCPHSTPLLASDGPLLARSQDIRTGKFLIEEAAHVSPETYRDRTRKATPTFGDLFYSREGTYFGIAAEVPANRQVCLGQRMVLIRPDLGMLNSRYLRYWLNSTVLAAHVNGHRDGTVAERLNLPTIRGLPIPIPPFREQHFISRVLGSLDDKIDLNRRMNETLEAIARAIFVSWFVDFDPVRAKAEGRPPHGMDSKTAGLFPGSFEESSTGPLPSDWRRVPLPEAFEVNPTRRLILGMPAPYLDMQKMPTNGHRAEDWIDRAVGSGMKFMNGDTLIARITPCLENGKTAFVDFLDEGQVGWGSTEYIVFRPRSPLPVEYAYFLARTDDFRAFAIQNMSGTSGRQRVPASCFDRYPVVMPSEGVAQAFGSQVRPLMAMIRQNSEQSQTLAALRDALLPKLLSGEIRVKDAEALAGSKL